MGQGALVLGNPGAIENPFFLMFPGWALWPVVLLSTMATVIASQAVITGAYSVTRQAIQLGLLPRLGIRHTSEEMAGQIYLPRVNWLLLLAVLLLVAVFKSSSALAVAYGVALADLAVCRPNPPSARHRARLFLRQRHQDLRGCLGAAGNFGRNHADHADLGQRHVHSQRDRPQAGRHARLAGANAREEAAASRERHRGVPDRQSSGGAIIAPAQFEAQSHAS